MSNLTAGNDVNRLKSVLRGTGIERGDPEFDDPTNPFRVNQNVKPSATKRAA